MKMDLSGIPQPRMDWESSNLPEAWKKFQQHVELVFNGPLKAKTEEVKCTYLLLWVGEKGRDIYNTWVLDDDDKKKLKPHYDKFAAYVRPKLNPVFTRYKFNNEVQGTHSIEQFITKLKLLAKDCAFGDYENDMVRDRIVFGVTSVKIREKLINEGDKLTLDKAIQIAQSYEYAQEQLKTMAAPTEVHYISNTTQKTSPIKGTHTNPKPQGKSDRKQRNRGARGMDKPGQQKYASDKCGNCGYKHTKTETCKAKGKQCNFCHKWNHFEIVCRSKKSVHEVSERNYDSQVQNSDSDDFFVDNVESNKLVNDSSVIVQRSVKHKRCLRALNKSKFKCACSVTQRAMGPMGPVLLLILDKTRHNLPQS